MDTIEPRMPALTARSVPAGACDVHCHVFGPLDTFATGPATYAIPLAAPSVYRQMLDSVGLDRGVLVQPMLPQGLEVIIGVNNDAQFGPMMLVGLGGVFVEVFKDTALYPAPLDKAEALDMLAGLKACKLLNGYRGAAPRDLDALAGCLAGIAAFAAAHKDSVRELDLNPVFVYEQGQGVRIADALIVKDDE